MKKLTRRRIIKSLQQNSNININYIRRFGKQTNIHIFLKDKVVRFEDIEKEIAGLEKLIGQKATKVDFEIDVRARDKLGKIIFMIPEMYYMCGRNTIEISLGPCENLANMPHRYHRVGYVPCLKDCKFKGDCSYAFKGDLANYSIL